MGFNYKEKYQDCGDKAEKVKNVQKVIALHKVNRIMNNKPWVMNRFHIEELRSASLSLSEIVHALLIMAHFHAVSGMSLSL